MLAAKKILIGVTGSIAAYKIAMLVRLLVKAGAEVKIIMTPSAAEFVTPLTLSTLSRNEVHVDLSNGKSWTNHVALGRWADLFLIAPLSCNTLAKMSSGLCDNLLMASYLSSTAPVVVAPAMDEDMWLHPSTKSNLKTIAGFGNRVLPVGNGDLASGLSGEGRMAEPEAIFSYLEEFFDEALSLKHWKALVTAGPTYEAIDPVRYIGNRSSGKMGLAVAQELSARGAEVTLIMGPSELSISDKSIKLVRIESAREMFDACLSIFDQVDLVVMAAAVADYKPETVSTVKIKKTTNSFTLPLVKTDDILLALGQRKTTQILAGFALETDNEKENATGKMIRKNADLMILNSLRDEGAGFGHDTNKITILTRSGESFSYELKDKQQVAKDIVDNIVKLRHA
ncbi:MAG: bifunctional phosphopantothenoylcysteine decarboxylase/phosphopantothenate--cysteine ligase CoaBC [Chitinophagaceae bacterium]